MAGMVLRMSFMSNQKEYLFLRNMIAYLLSSCLRSSSDIFPDLPLNSTYHNPVRPAGARNRRAILSSVSFSAS